MLPFRFARRYLFSKKSTNAINIISSISVLGMMLGTAALIIVLSVFNGFEDLITGLYNSFNPDIKVEVIEGKVFVPDPTKLAQLKKIEGVKAVSETMQEIAFFEYDTRQDFGILKGVDKDFAEVTGILAAIQRGSYQTTDGETNFAVVGSGMEYQLSINADDPFVSLNVYMPKRKQSLGGIDAPFKMQPLGVSGVFSIQADLDGQYILTDLECVRNLTGYYNGEVTNIEIAIQPNANLKTIQAQVKAIMGSGFTTKNRYEQDEAFYKIMNIERWVGFAITTFTLLLVAFNMVGALWMLVLEKRRDIAILKSMGATNQLIQRIFLAEGLLLSTVGTGLGFAIAIGFILLQKYCGLIPLEGNMVVSSYPISMRFGDFVLVALTVVCIGLLASYLPARRAAQIKEIDLK